MATSLLAHLYSHIRGSQEDIATLSLQYILSQSPELSRAFTRSISSSLCIKLESDLQYITQATGKNKERPDLAGIDVRGQEIVLCEMKFYAGLTSNQPLAYIDRLKENSGSGLLFICPNARLISLWSKLKDTCSNRTIESIHDFCIKVDGISLAITSWTDIIELLTKTAASVAVDLLADIKQLEGYCAQMDSDAFIPFSPEDLSAGVAKRAEGYYAVIDELINLLCDDPSIQTSLKGVKATAYRNGYTRSIAVDEFRLTINYDRNLWKSSNSKETPFWIAIRDSDWGQPEKFSRQFDTFPSLSKESFWNMTFLALDPPHRCPLVRCMFRFKATNYGVLIAFPFF